MKKDWIKIPSVGRHFFDVFKFINLHLMLIFPSIHTCEKINTWKNKLTKISQTDKNLLIYVDWKIK